MAKIYDYFIKENTYQDILLNELIEIHNFILSNKNLFKFD